MLSKNPLISRSITQSNCQHRCRACPTASSADFPTICAIRSDTVGIPSFLSPPFAFGIFTVRTGGGKYLPDDIRFQILYRFPFRFLSKSAIDCSSTPAAPWFAFTRLYASQTSCLEIQNGFASLIGSSHCWLAH